MATTKGTTDGPQRHFQIVVQRHGVGIILTIFTILFLMGTGAAPSAQARTFTLLHRFAGGTNDGANPEAGLVMDSAGNLYGTTYSGGGNGKGTVFKLDSSGTLTVLHGFVGGTNDGAHPQAGLVRDSDGNLYGTTELGGSSSDGTVFKLDTSGGGFAVLHDFSGYPSDGAQPRAGLVRDSDGNLYGTTFAGGSATRGTVFKLDPSGTLTVLHSLAFNTSTANPWAGLVRDSDGNLYGTTYNGGSFFGSVFKLDPSGTLSVLHSFDGSDGANPEAGLVMDSAGNLYGTTYYGGSRGSGTVFKLDPSGTLTVLHGFVGGTNDGANPEAGLVMDSAGNLYGTTYSGGSSGNCSGGCGTVFKLDTSGTLTVLHSFDGSDGANPEAGLVMDSAGNLYGTTYYGGPHNDGTVFVISATPQAAIQLIITQVNGLLAQRVINGQQGGSLIQELNLAFAMINAGKINDAITDLGNFITEVTNLENAHVLTIDQATTLINSATDVIAQLT